jgi:hypothetical protein
VLASSGHHASLILMRVLHIEISSFILIYITDLYILRCQAHHELLSDKPNIVSLPSGQEQQKQEATFSSNSCKVTESELPQTPVLHSVPPADKVSISGSASSLSVAFTAI